jgi:hypothetical protein
LTTSAVYAKKRNRYKEMQQYAFGATGWGQAAAARNPEQSGAASKYSFFHNIAAPHRQCLPLRGLPRWHQIAGPFARRSPSALSFLGLLADHPHPRGSSGLLSSGAKQGLSFWFNVHYV